MDSEEADEERRLLFTNEEDQEERFEFGVSEEAYLDRIFSCRGSGEWGGSASNGGGSGVGNGGGGGGGSNGTSAGVISLEQIRKLPLKRQVH